MSEKTLSRNDQNERDGNSLNQIFPDEIGISSL